MSTYAFDQSSIARIARAVKAFERGGPPRANDGTGTGGGVGFWAKLTAEDSHQYYQWTKQKITNGTFEDDTPTSGGDYSAHEANTASGLTGKYVWLTFIGYGHADGGSSSSAAETAQYLFTVGGTSPPMVHITSTAAGKAVYNGNVLTNDATNVTASTDVAALTDLWTVGDACLIVNIVDITAILTHTLDPAFSPTIWPATFYATNTDGVAIYVITGYQYDGQCNTG